MPHLGKVAILVLAFVGGVVLANKVKALAPFIPQV